MPTKRSLPQLWHGGAPFDAFHDLSRLQRKIDRIFEDFFSPAQGRESEESFSPACDLEETEQNYLLSFDLPGMKKEDLKIEIRENQLTVSGERKKEEQKEREKGRISTERYYGSFVRSFTLPGSIDPDKVEASYEDGVLRISLPKTAASSKQIPIREGKLLGKAA